MNQPRPFAKVTQNVKMKRRFADRAHSAKTTTYLIPDDDRYRSIEFIYLSPHFLSKWRNEVSGTVPHKKKDFQPTSSGERPL